MWTQVTCYFHNECDMSIIMPVWVVTYTWECVFGWNAQNSPSSYLTASQSTSWSAGHRPLRVPEIFAGNLWAQNYFPNNTKTQFAFFSIGTAMGGAHAIMGIAAINQGGASAITVFFTTLLQKGNNSPFHLSTSFDEAIEVKNCVKSQSWVNVFLIFCVMNWWTHTDQRGLTRKAPVEPFGLRADLAAFVDVTSFILDLQTNCDHWD